MRIRVRRVGPRDELHATEAADLLRGLVAGGGALGWVDPPPVEEVRALLVQVHADAAGGDAALVVALESLSDGERLIGLGYWRRYARPTHRVHADVEKVALDLLNSPSLP